MDCEKCGSALDPVTHVCPTCSRVVLNPPPAETPAPRLVPPTVQMSSSAPQVPPPPGVPYTQAPPPPHGGFHAPSSPHPEVRPAPMTPPPPGGLHAPPPIARPYGAPPASSSMNGMAIAALVLGLAGMCSCGITSVFGLIFGLIALRQANEAPEDTQNRGIAIAGAALSGVTLLISLVRVASCVQQIHPTFH